MTLTEPIHSARRSDLESWLDTLGARWEFTADLILSKVDQDASLANQARRDPLNHEVVDQYARAMHRGDQFPPLLVHDTDPPTLLGGNHRYAAHLTVGNITCPAYLVKAPPAVLLRLRFEDNARHGLPPTPQERIDHAIGLIRHGMTQHTAAAIAGVAQPQLSKAVAVLDMSERAARLNVDLKVNSLPETTRYSLSRIISDEVFAAVAALTVKASLPKKVVDDLVTASNSTEPAEALRIVDVTAQEYSSRARDLAGNVRRSSRTARAQLETNLAVIRSLDPIDVYDSCPNDDTRAVLAQRILDASKVLYKAHALLTGKAQT